MTELANTLLTESVSSSILNSFGSYPAAQPFVVYFGRGMYNEAGNVASRQVIESRLDEYRKARTQQQKTHIVNQVRDFMIDQTDFVFLKRTTQGFWDFATTTQIRGKVRHCLTDAALRQCRSVNDDVMVAPDVITCCDLTSVPATQYAVPTMTATYDDDKPDITNSSNQVDQEKHVCLDKESILVSADSDDETPDLDFEEMLGLAVWDDDSLQEVETYKDNDDCEPISCCYYYDDMEIVDEDAAFEEAIDVLIAMEEV